MDFSVINSNSEADVWVSNVRTHDDVILADIHLLAQREVILQPFGVFFSMDAIDIYSMWNTNAGAIGIRQLGPNWRKQTTHSRLASGMPLHSLLSISGHNRMTIAVSDVKTPISIATGICEETAQVECKILFYTDPAPATEYVATIRLDMRDVPFCDSIYDVVAWWEKDYGYLDAYIPEMAKLPVNSLWYSFHQKLDPDEILEQCILSKPLGMDTVIIDDGWQTDDNNRGYDYCGDWELAISKIPDMKKLVDRIHQIGMKVILWYSVPYVGIYSKKYQDFKDMLLNPRSPKKISLDPRYKEVRDYLVNTYVDAVQNWGIDGLKLDFISAFRLTEDSILPDPRRDYYALEDGIEALMEEITENLYRRKPDILLEFRQPYIGPAIRKYGNMLRAGDCPNDTLSNRISVIDLRLTAGKTPVHSDMLMWNPKDTVESAALQIASVLYSVPQISVRIDKLPEEHYRMLKYYLAFWRKNRDVLLNGKLTAENPQSFYTQAATSLGDAEIVTLYATSVVTKNAEKTTIVNASHTNRIYLDGFEGLHYCIVNCMGEEIEKGNLEKLSVLTVPTAGMVFVNVL